MTVALGDKPVSGILLDIEGTTTPIAFVSDVLFPFARAHMREYLARHASTPHVRDAVRLLVEEHRRDAAMRAAPPEWRDETPASIAGYVEWLMDRDRKSPGLKLLQGFIWEGGYRSGTLKGEVFADVRPAFERWRRAGIAISIYSSGSGLAQRLLFGTTAEGDLVPFISAFFDTTVGAKTSRDSYCGIAHALGCSTNQILFVSDSPAELDAAGTAGCQTLFCVRPGNREADAGSVPTIRSFDEIV